MPVRDYRGVKTARDNAPRPREFRKLKRAAQDLDTFSLQIEFLLVALGDLGLRAGELAHLSRGWVDLDRFRLEIPSYEDCSCGYCRKAAEQQMEYEDNDESQAIEDYMKKRWEPKTAASRRVIPYGHDESYVDTFDRFFDEYPQGWPNSRASINRRVDRVAEAAGMDPEEVYPHALRAHAGHQYVRRGLRAHHLKKVMGWSSINAAVDYVEMSAPDVEEVLYGYGEGPPRLGRR